MTKNALIIWVFFAGLTAIAVMDTSVLYAGYFQWTDADGAVHFSDTPPSKKTRKVLRVNDDTGTASPVQSQSDRINKVVYQDDVFTLVLKNETPSSLAFELTYQDIDRAFPRVLKSETTVFLSAVSGTATGTLFLLHDTPKIEGTNNTVTVLNQLTKQSPSDMETDNLRFTLYQENKGRGYIGKLFEKRIPFKKVWWKSQ